MSETETVTLPNGAIAPAVKSISTEEPIDPNLLDKLAALKSIVKIDKLLQNGIFAGGMAGDILIGQEFLKDLYKPIRAECETHKDFARATGAVTSTDTQALQRAEEKRERKMNREKVKAAKKAKAN